MEYTHKSVLLQECLDGLNIKPDGIYVDGTLGRAGHSREIAKRLTSGRLIGIDRDAAALEAAPTRLEGLMDRVTLVRGNFSQVGEILRKLDIPAVDGMLFDLGVSSPQLDEAARGFSYLQDAPLDMRMDQSAALTAYEVVNEWSQEELKRILWQYGEERYAGPIAAAIVRHRAHAPVRTTLELADLIRSAMPAKAHPGVGGFDPQRHARQGVPGETAPGQAVLPGHSHRRQRRVGGSGADAGYRPGPFESRRAAGYHFLPLPGGPSGEDGLCPMGQGLYLPPGLPCVRVREDPQGAPGGEKAHCFHPPGT